MLFNSQGTPVVAGVPAAAAAPRGFPPAYAPGRPTWRLTTMHQSVPRATTYPTQPGSALIEQLTRPPSITPQFNSKSAFILLVVLSIDYMKHFCYEKFLAQTKDLGLSQFPLPHFLD